MINVNSNFHLGSKDFLDSRQSVENLDELLALNTNIIPNGFQVYINELDTRYQYHENYNEADTGNWKLVESNSGTSSSTYIINCAVGLESDGSLIVDSYDGDFTKIKQTIANGGKVELRTNFNGYDYILEPSKIEEDYIAFNTVNKNENITIQVSEYGVYTASYIDLNSGGSGDYSKVYTSLAELGLDTTATINDIIGAMAKGSIIAIKVDAMADQSEYNNITQGTVTIHKIENARVQTIMTEKATGRTWVGVLGGNNTITGWKELRSDALFHRIITQGTAGYFKFKPCSNPKEQGIRITATDNYGGMIDISGVTPNDAQYKPFKAVRLSNGTYASYDASKTTNNKMQKLFLYDGYMYLQVLSYTTVTFTNLIEEPTFVETLDTTVAEEIPIKSVFDGKAYTTLTDLNLTADATIDDVISALGDGETAIITTNEFTNYLTMFPNQCTNDQYAILKVEKKNSNRCFIEWRQKEGDAYAIGGLSSSNTFTDWVNIVRFKNDGFADNSIVAIGDAVSSDGTIQTLDSLGFSTDILTWDTGVYRVSHVSGLTNLPSDITSAQPGFRLEHHDCKKWGVNHNPSTQTWALRHSVLYAEGGGVYHRYYESGATAGVYTKDTGWQKIIVENSSTDPYSCTGYTVLTGTEDLFTLAPGHYASAKVDTAYNYPVTDSSNVTAHIYVLGHLNDPTNNKGYRIILYFDNKGRMYRINEWWGSFDNGWQKIEGNTTLVTNTQTLKLDITKKNSSWYGAIKLTYLYDTSPVDIEISFRSATEDLRWAVINGQKYINKITYTQDSSNTAHYTIGIEFAGTTYGCYQAEVIGGFADINSLTKDAFTGAKTAVYNSPWGKNNGVTLVSAPEDIGLTSPCTTVQLVQAMRNKFNKTITSGAIGVFNNGGSTITDAPSDYGLLHIEVFGHDRVMIRYDGISSSTYTGSWIGKIKGSAGTFSGIAWSKIAMEGESSGDIAWTTATINSGVGYANNSSGGYSTKYAVKNDVVHINSNITCNTVKDSGYDTFITGLPAPSTNLFFTLQPDVYGNAPIIAQVDKNGNLKLRNGTAGKTYMVSISYPII